MKRLPLLPLLVAGLAAIIVLEAVGFAASASLPAGGPFLVIAPPWRGGPEAIVAAAGGQLIGPTQAFLSVLADGTSEQALREAGAWGILDPSALPMFCSPAMNGAPQ